MAVFENNDFDETFFGVAGEYNQVDYRGSLSEFRIYRNEDGSVTVEHPTLGTDTLFDIDGFWFGADASWYSIDDAIAMTDGAAEGENFRIDRWGNLIGRVFGLAAKRGGMPWKTCFPVKLSLNFALTHGET